MQGEFCNARILPSVSFLSFSGSLALLSPAPRPGPPFPLASAALELVSGAAEGAGSRPSRGPSQSPGKDEGACGQWRIPTCCGGRAASKRGSGGGGGRTGGQEARSGRGAPSGVAEGCRHQPETPSPTTQAVWKTASRGEGGGGDTRNGGAWEARVTGRPPQAPVLRPLRSSAPCARDTPPPPRELDRPWARGPRPALTTLALRTPARPREAEVTVAGLDGGPSSPAPAGSAPARSGSQSQGWSLAVRAVERPGREGSLRRPGTSEGRQFQKGFWRPAGWPGRGRGGAELCAPWTGRAEVNLSGRRSAAGTPAPSRAHSHLDLAVAPPLALVPAPLHFSPACALLVLVTPPGEVANRRGRVRERFPPAAPPAQGALLRGGGDPRGQPPRERPSEFKAGVPRRRGPLQRGLRQEGSGAGEGLIAGPETGAGGRASVPPLWSEPPSFPAHRPLPGPGFTACSRGTGGETPQLGSARAAFCEVQRRALRKLAL